MIALRRHQASRFATIIVVAPILLLTLSGGGVGEVADIAPDELAARIRESQALARTDFDTTFEIRTLKYRPADEESPWNLDAYDRLESHRYVCAGDRLYVNRRDLMDDSPSAYEQINVWDGSSWTLRIVGEDAATFSAGPFPPDLLGHGFIFNAMEGRFPSYRALADLVETGRPLSQSLDEGVLTYRFARDDVRDDLTQYEFVTRLTPAFQLLSYASEIYSSDGSLIGRQTYTIDEWRQVGAHKVPEQAEITGWTATHPATGQPPPLALRTIFTRKDFMLLAPGEADDALFITPLPTGTRVHDARLNLSFEIGNRYLYLDGRMYQVDEAVLSHPGERLDEMIRAAEIQLPREQGREKNSGEARMQRASGHPTAELVDEPATPWKRVIFVAILVVAAAAIAAFVVLISKRNSLVQ